MHFLKKLSNIFSVLSVPPLFDDDSAIFAGTGNGHDFRLYVLGVLVSASATNETVIKQLQRMKIGQEFKITREGNDGENGRLIEAIEVDDDMPVHNIPSHIPPVLTVESIHNSPKI